MAAHKPYKRKVDKKGRNTGQQFIRLLAEVTSSRAWQSLRCEARSLLIEIWARHNGTNNGKISTLIERQEKVWELEVREPSALLSS